MYVRHVGVRDAILVNSPVKVNTFWSSLFLEAQMFVTHWPLSNSQSLSNTHSSPTVNIKKKNYLLPLLSNEQPYSHLPVLHIPRLLARTILNDSIMQNALWGVNDNSIGNYISLVLWNNEKSQSISHITKTSTTMYKIQDGLNGFSKSK